MSKKPNVARRRARHSGLALFLLALLPILAHSTTTQLRSEGQLLTLELSEQFAPAMQNELIDWLDHISTVLLQVYGRWPRDHWEIEVTPVEYPGSDPIPSHPPLTHLHPNSNLHPPRLQLRCQLICLSFPGLERRRVHLHHTLMLSPCTLERLLMAGMKRGVLLLSHRHRLGLARLGVRGRVSGRVRGRTGMRLALLGTQHETPHPRT